MWKHIGIAEMTMHNKMNLVECSVSDITGQRDLNERAWAASFVATLQAGYTNFHYLRSIWNKTSEEDALIGVGMTGIGSGGVLKYNIEEAARWVKLANLDVSEAINIFPANRTTTIKPSGTSSIVLSCSSGIHAWHNDYYIRRIRLGKNEPLYSYLYKVVPELIEDDYFNPHTQAVLSVPQEAPKGSILRTESAVDLLKRVLLFNKDWVRAGHRFGDNPNNVSCTLSLKEEDWPTIGEMLWKHREEYNGISVLPYDGGTYVQAPFEDITEWQFNNLSKHLHAIDLTRVNEEEDNTNLVSEPACAGGVCEIG